MCTVWPLHQNDWVSRAWIYIKFCIKLEHSFMEIIWMIQKTKAMGNWWLGSFIMTSCLLMHHISCSSVVKHHITRWLSPSTAPLVPFNFWLFPKLKSPLKGKRFQTLNEIQENITGQLMAIGRTLWHPKVPTLKRDWDVIVLCTMFLVSCIFFSKCLYFAYYISGDFLHRPLEGHFVTHSLH